MNMIFIFVFDLLNAWNDAIRTNDSHALSVQRAVPCVANPSNIGQITIRQTADESQRINERMSFHHLFMGSIAIIPCTHGITGEANDNFWSISEYLELTSSCASATLSGGCWLNVLLEGIENIALLIWPTLHANLPFIVRG